MYEGIIIVHVLNTDEQLEDVIQEKFDDHSYDEEKDLHYINGRCYTEVMFTEVGIIADEMSEISTYLLAPYDVNGDMV